jgi:hypothetical protein
MGGHRDTVKRKGSSLVHSLHLHHSGGNGQKASFWNSGWLHGQRSKDIAPLLYLKTRKKKRTVVASLLEKTWIRDLNYRSGFTTTHLAQFATLWNLVANIELQLKCDDNISWKLTPNGEYAVALAYRAQFNGCINVTNFASI